MPRGAAVRRGPPCKLLVGRLLSFAKATVDGDLRPVVNTVDSTSDGAPRHDMRVSQACF